jgi:hypothetical protein
MYHLGLFRTTVIAAVILCLPSVASAQSARFFIDGAGGVALPTGELNKLVNAGPTVGLEIGYRLTDRLALRLNGDVQDFVGASLSGSVTRGPDMRVSHYAAGFQANLLRSRNYDLTGKRWQLVADVGLGLARFSSDKFRSLDDQSIECEFGHTYFAAQGGVRLAYVPTRRLSVYIGGKALQAFTRKEHTTVLAAIDPDRLQPFGSALTLPITAGLSVKI